MAGHEPDRLCVIPVRQRNTGVGGTAGGSGNSRHDLKPDAGIRQCLNLLATAPEDKRIAALEADNLLALPGQIHQSLIDLILRQGVVGPLLANMNHLCGVRDHGQYFRRNQTIVEDNLSGCNQPPGLECQQLGISRPGPNEGHLACGCVRVRGNRVHPVPYRCRSCTNALPWCVIWLITHWILSTPPIYGLRTSGTTMLPSACW